MKKIPSWVYVILIVALLIASKFIFFSKKTENVQGTAKGKNVMPLAVNYYVVAPSKFTNDVFATGRIGAMNQVDILPEVNGKIIAIYFKEGETVTKGSLLVKLNDADLQAQLLKTHTQLKLSEQKLQRLEKLLAVKGISQEEFDMQENEIATLKADEAFFTAQIAKTNIMAPFSGVIGLKNISEGSFVNATTPIVSLVQMKPVYVEFSVPEKYADIFKRGTQVNFSVDNQQTSTSYSASIYAIEPKVDENTKTIKARAAYNGERIFYPGSFVKVFVNLGETANALMVPTQAVIPTLKGQKVFVAHGDSAVEVPVKIGVRTDQMIQVTEGLNAGDSVITTGLLSIKKGSKLKLTKASK
jgi:membrane fusion protein (multidrug efflux system)